MTIEFALCADEGKTEKEIIAAELVLFIKAR
jgi:hypothetical protein